MPAHIKRRDNDQWYLIDGSIRISLKTDVKRLAEARLAQYQHGKFSIKAVPAVGEYFEKWIEEQKPLARPSALRDYSQHFSTYVLPEFASTLMDAVTVDRLSSFRNKLLTRGLSLKTCRNIIDASFRAMHKRARVEGVISQNPFELLDWPDMPKPIPQPYTMAEMAAILAWVKKNEEFYWPFVMFQFETGARPSESTAIKFGDVKWTQIFIHASRHLKEERATKTRHARRIINVGLTLAAILAEQRLPFFGDQDPLFYNKYGRPLNAEHWTKEYWPSMQEELGLNRRGFYSTRHTFITEQVKAGKNLKAIADYCGTSVQMIEEDYCARLDLVVPEMTNRTAEPTTVPEPQERPANVIPINRKLIGGRR